jgi:hypothetical protein
MPTDNPNILFLFSGVLGVYKFEQNPMTMDVFTPKEYYNTIGLLEGENIYQRSLLDNEIRVMRWDEATTNLYTNLKAFAVRDSFNNIPVTYFWDGLVYEFQGAPIQVVDVWGQPLESKDGKWKIELQFKWVQV